ncbi:MAG: hypothetical protein LBJ45_00025 [Holosporaceae bacterium]|nr:hypothetical protein [Holosporaceae bacterium]
MLFIVKDVSRDVSSLSFIVKDVSRDANAIATSADTLRTFFSMIATPFHYFAPLPNTPNHDAVSWEHSGKKHHKCILQ